MRKEIIGILLFFFVIFTLISLLSYSPGDPSINNAKAAGEINNLFGVFGAHTAGILIGLFGIGAFWLPILFLLMSIHFFGKHANQTIIYKAIGGLLLTITTGALLAFHSNHFMIFGNRFSSGGIIGIPLTSFLVKYSNATGGIIILALLWLIGFILTTGFSLAAFYRFCRQKSAIWIDRMWTLMIKWKERRERQKSGRRQFRPARKKKHRRFK